jgi:hypothetical protein
MPGKAEQAELETQYRTYRTGQAKTGWKNKIGKTAWAEQDMINKNR